MTKVKNIDWRVKRLAKDFKLCRLYNNASLRDIEKETGISNSFLSQFENGQCDISFSKALKLYDIMGKDLIPMTSLNSK